MAVVAASQSSDEAALQPTRQAASAGIEGKVNNLLKRMTVDEKLQQPRHRRRPNAEPNAATLPVFELREAGRRCRLVRKNKGTLVLTPTGRALRQDPDALWWHLTTSLPDAGDDIERDAGTMLLLAVGAGLPLTWDIARKVVTDGLAAAGWQISGTGEPLNEWQAFEAARDTWTILEQLAALVRPRYGDPPAVPTPAAVTFARAALRGSEWSSSTAAARG